MFKIYKLVHAGKIVYIGCTTQELKRRKSNGYRSNEAVNSIRKECEIELIEETDDKARESYWIRFYKKQGVNLLNIRDGITNLDKTAYWKRFNTLNAKQLKEYRKLYYRKWREKNRNKYNEYMYNYMKDYNKK
jgi:hypothetical protein